MSDSASKAPSSEGEGLSTLVLTPAGERTEAEAPPIVSGAQLGRYVAIETLGTGGMGTVIRAYDPKLRREVALKRLRSSALDEEGEARLVREAQAMAQLSHPNVVAVYDVHSDGDGVMLAMEYVRGVTLRRWLEDGPRRGAEVLAAFTQAGAGLAAAHRVGLVHRDFKPANALLTEEGASSRGSFLVKVTDFGLAKHASGPGSERDGSVVSKIPAVAETVDTLDTPLTRDDVVMGTPRYMAPEQHAGRPATAASDQFAFCVALWEALCGDPPYTPPSLRAKRAGPPAWPRPSSVPTSIGVALRRGLAPEVQERFADMEALLAALHHDAGAARRRKWALGLIGFLGVGGAAAAYALAQEPEDPCRDVDDRAQGLWDEARRSHLETALRETGLPFVDDSWRHISKEIDQYVERWLSQHRDVCEASHAQTQPVDVLALRTSCLDRAQRELSVVLRALEKADRKTLERVDGLLASLPAPAQCGDTKRLAAEFAPPQDPALVPRVNATMDRLREARAASNLGRYDDAENILEEIRGDLDAINHMPVRFEWSMAAGDVAKQRGDYERAEALLREAFALGTVLGARHRQIDAASQLGVVLAVGQAKHDEGRWWGELALSLAERYAADTSTEGLAANNLAKIVDQAGDFREGEALMRRALALDEAEYGPDHPEVASSLSNLAAILREQGRYDEAEPLSRRSVEILQEQLGEEHPSVIIAMLNLANHLQMTAQYEQAEAIYRDTLRRRSAVIRGDLLSATIMNNLAELLRRRGESEEAVQLLREVLEIRENKLGPDHLEVASALNNLAIALRPGGNYDEIEALHRRALKIRETVHGSEHPSIAVSLNNLAVVFEGQDRDDEAATTYQRALEIGQSVFGDEHPLTATLMSNLARAKARLGDTQEAEGLLRRALELRTRLLGEDHPDRASTMTALAELLLEQGDIGEATTLTNEAQRILDAVDVPAEDRAETAFMLAKVRWANGERTGARDAAKRARDLYQTAGPSEEEELREVRTWLARHRER